MKSGTNKFYASIMLGVILLGLLVYFQAQKDLLLTKPPAEGVSFVLEPHFSETEDRTNELAQLKEALLKRAARVGTQFYWEQISESQIRILASTENSDLAGRLESVLFQGGVLEFRFVHELNDQLILTGEAPPGFEILSHERNASGRSGIVEQVVVKRTAPADLSGNLIDKAMATEGSLGEWDISFTLQSKAATAFSKVTRENVGRRLAILVDGKLYAAPRIAGPIEAGSGMIAGGFDKRAASELALVLDTALPIPVKVVETKRF